jgi:3-oxoadipate CoA-transferase beta subunit
VTADGLVVREIFSDIDFTELQKLTGIPLIDATQPAASAA